MGNYQTRKSSATPEEDGDLKCWTMSEIEAYSKENKDSVVMIIHKKVYDVTRFLPEHPGGSLILETFRGRDASEEFDDTGHSKDAVEMMEEYLVGIVKS